MSTNEVWARCRDCGTELKRDDKQCPKCGSTRKSYDVELSSGFVLDSAIQVQQIRGYEFEDYIFQLLTLNQNFRNVRENFPVGREPSLFADIVAEEKVNGEWRNIIVECKSATTFTQDRLYTAIAQLKKYQSYSPTSKLILAFPGRLSVQASKTLKNANIEIWDLSYPTKLRNIFNEIVQSIVGKGKHKQNKLIIVVDNLDRCSSEAAIFYRSLAFQVDLFSGSRSSP